jgi:hypothetical protein
MEIQPVDAARRWLTERGVRQVREGRVSDEESDVLLTANEVAHSWAGEVFTEDLGTAEQLRLAFGLLDLLDGYWVTCEIRFAHASAAGPLPAGVLWDGYRRRLEADSPVEPVTYSLWADWFQDRATSATAFAEVLGNDIDRLVAQPSKALLRRARRVSEISGPVPWPVKESTYRTAGRLPALFHALRASFHDVYGDLQPAAGLTLSTSWISPPTPPTAPNCATSSPRDITTTTAAPTPGTRRHTPAPEADPGLKLGRGLSRTCRRRDPVRRSSDRGPRETGVPVPRGGRRCPRVPTTRGR